MEPGDRSVQRRQVALFDQAIILPLTKLPLTKLWRGLSRCVGGLFLGLIHFYQRFISPGLRPSCRFVPSCSVYAAESLKKYGVWKGVGRSVWRVARCNPLCKGGLDEP